MKFSDKKFIPSSNFKVAETFKNCFGVIGSDEKEPEEIILSFTPFQWEYIKSLPLHHSQKLVKDNKNKVQVSLKIYATHDFIMELLSFGKEVKALKP